MTESEFKKLVSEFTDEQNTVTVAGSGLWYDFSYAKKIANMDHYTAMNKWKDTMNDANLIKGTDYPKEINSTPSMYSYGKQKVYTFDPIKFFKSEEAKMLKIVTECDIFISHIGPVVPPNLPLQYQNAVTGFYYFDGEYLLARETAPKLWIFGHTHDKYFWKYNNTYLACNPLGYKSENKGTEIEVVNYYDL